MRKPKPTPKPMRVWALVNRMGRTPYILWTVISHTRRNIEFQYLYWLCGDTGPDVEKWRAEFRSNVESGDYTIERVTIATEARDV